MDDLKTVAYAVKELKDDVREVKKDVKSLMMFMAVEKSNQAKNIRITSALMSLLVSLIVFGITKIASS